MKRTAEPLDPLLTIRAYQQGIFPMPDHQGKIRWYAPDPRAILEHADLSISRSLRRTLRQEIYEIRIDTSFEQVMRNCADREETWINEEFIKTYSSQNLAYPRLRALYV